MIPFLGMGMDQLAYSIVGEPVTDDNVKLIGDDETESDSTQEQHSTLLKNSQEKLDLAVTINAVYHIH